MIIPTVGRIVWYRAGDARPETPPLAAIVAYVWSSRMVNLAVFDAEGGHFPKTSVRLIQDGDSPAGWGEPTCSWMPYQKGQAAKTEALEAKLGG